MRVTEFLHIGRTVVARTASGDRYEGQVVFVDMSGICVLSTGDRSNTFLPWTAVDAVDAP